ncbi:unnamed protein product [Sympodiomycopsis kandeliae]
MSQSNLHSRLRAARVRPMRNREGSGMQERPRNDLESTTETRKRVNELNFGLANEGLCQWIGTRKLSTQKAHILPSSETWHARSFVWARSLGLLSTNITESQKDKLLPTNLVRLSKTLHESLGDDVSSSASSSGPQMVIMPTKACLLQAIELSEQVLANQELLTRNTRPSTWTFSASQLLEEWPARIQFDDQDWPLFQYELSFFVADVEDWNARMPFAWPARLDNPIAPAKQMVNPLVVADDKWPTHFDESFPVRSLPLSLPLVLLFSLSQLWSLARTFPLRRDFGEVLEWSDYFLSLCEAEDPHSWRARRPTNLPFQAPTSPEPAASTSRWPMRRYEWPSSAVTRERSASVTRQQQLEPYWSFSSSPHKARQEPLIDLVGRAQGLVLTSSSSCGMMKDEFLPGKQSSISSSSSAGGRADDERSSSGDGLILSDGLLAGVSYTSFQTQGVERREDAESPPELTTSEEELSDEEIAIGLAAGIASERIGLLQELFDHVMESDSVATALAALRRGGIESVDRILHSKVNNFDSDVKSFAEWCDQVGVLAC